MNLTAEATAEDEEDNLNDMHLVFAVSGEQYAVAISHVIEIIGLQKIIEVPDVPSYIKGVINLRGQIIPIMDLRLRFHLAEIEYSDRTVIIVLDHDGVKTGLVVDGVREVLEFSANDINAPPKWQGNETNGVIKAIAKQGENVSIVLEIEKLLYSNECKINEHTSRTSHQE